MNIVSRLFHFCGGRSRTRTGAAKCFLCEETSFFVRRPLDVTDTIAIWNVPTGGFFLWDTVPGNITEDGRTLFMTEDGRKDIQSVRLSDHTRTSDRDDRIVRSRHSPHERKR